jgi:poly-gamma-glutamate capsule biosynthesis protein CapA/YwtB (metallophosphatase superfamily)
VIRPFLVADDAEVILRALGLAPGDGIAELVDGSSIVERVSSAPGSFALVRPEALDPRVLALSIDRYDPYADPASRSPVQTPGGQQGPSPFRPVLVTVTGELIPARCSNFALEIVGDDGAMFDGVRELLTAADLAVAQLETPLTDRSPPTPCVETVVLQGRAAIAGVIADAGIDVVATIGNHVTDCWEGCDGRAALLDTLANLKEAGVLTTGAGANAEEALIPAIVEVIDGSGEVVRFAILGFDTIARWNAATSDAAGVAAAEPTRVAERVAAATRLADHVVVAINWGIEYTADPTLAQIELADVARRAGADLVVGNHPHWVQAVDAQPAGVIAYSLGNFVFDQAWSVPTTQGAILEASFAGGRIVGYRLRPIVIRGVPGVPSALYRPELVDDSSAEGREILGRIWRASEHLAGAASDP